MKKIIGRADGDLFGAIRILYSNDTTFGTFSKCDVFNVDVAFIY